MNTPSHIVFNLAVLDKRGNSNRVFPVFLGAILPDVPIFILFFWEKFVKGASQSKIWGEIYFRDDWQLFIDIFNSIPITLFILIITKVFLKGSLKDFIMLFCYSMLLHFMLDLPLHHDDAHRHFLPISNWRFISPLSYWDVAHHAREVVIGETLLAVISCIALIYKKRTIITFIIFSLSILVFGFYAWSFLSGSLDLF